VRLALASGARRGLGAALAVLALVSALGGLVLGFAYSAKDGLLMGLFMLASGTPPLVAAHLLVQRRAARGSLGRQFASAVAVTIGLVTVGVFTVALLMFISGHDAVVMSMLLLLAGGLTAYSTWLLSRDVIAERDAAEKARRDLVAAVSHDLRTPLTSLRLLADAIEDDVVDRDTRHSYLEQMSVHIRSLSALIEDLFELSRLEAGDIRWSLQQVRIDELVEETVEAMRAQADAKQVAVSAAIPAGLEPVRGNPEKLQRVLFNLIQNAIRHTPADGSVTVMAEPNGGGVEVEVADTGQGLSADEQQRAFEPFYRGGDGAARSGGGTGLGLTICRAIVEAHGGRIWLADSRRGARVRFSLPR
jgi:signal transduction histidine kinase